MKVPTIPPDESARLETLRALRILDTEPEERFDRLTRIAQHVFGVEISLVSLVDESRQWFKSAQGLDASETPRDISFCGHAINSSGIFLISNALEDERFYDNPLVKDAPHIRFYAGRPIQALNGHRLGTLCLIDSRPKELTEKEQALFNDLAKLVEQEIALLQLATLDDLTGISNRRGFTTVAEHALKLCRRNNIPATLLMFDLDDFKQINDTYGHAEGDKALKAFSNLLSLEFRESDVIGRLGGDEFAVLLAGTASEDMQQAVKRLEVAAKRFSEEDNKDYILKFSTGDITISPECTDSIETYLDRADKAMFDAKEVRKA